MCLAPRLVVGAIYKHLNEMMKLPWTADLKTHTIHVEDLVRATHHLCLHGKPGEVRTRLGWNLRHFAGAGKINIGFMFSPIDL